MVLPVAVEPVKTTLFTSSCSARRAPASRPVPVTTLTTPSGTPASCINFAIIKGVSGASSEGFNTTVQPVAKAGAIFQIEAAVGAFQGIIAPTTPTGSRVVKENIDCETEFSITSPCNATACPA